VGERGKKIPAEYVEYLSSVNCSDGLIAAIWKCFEYAPRAIQLRERTTYFCFRFCDLLFGLCGLGRWWIRVRHCRNHPTNPKATPISATASVASVGQRGGLLDAIGGGGPQCWT
jgi:hypothetical protein